MKASAIPSISDEITTVNTSLLPELLGLPDAKIHRGKEHVDLLIGIDHVHMHTGDTRQVEYLLVRNSPLVWVVFGGNPTATSYVTRILHVTFATPLDLYDFWTSETMVVMVKPCVKRCGQVVTNGKKRKKNDRRLLCQNRKPVGDPLPMAQEPQSSIRQQTVSRKASLLFGESTKEEPWVR